MRFLQLDTGNVGTIAMREAVSFLAEVFANVIYERVLIADFIRRSMMLRI